MPECLYLICWGSKKQEGASKEDIEQLSKFKFQRTETNEKHAGNTQGAAGGIMIECDADSPIEHVLSDEDVVHFAMCWLGLFLPCPGVLFALSVARYYYKGKSMYSPNIGLVISHSIEPCFECIPTLDNAL